MEITYKKSGVDIEKANLFKEAIAKLARRSFGKEVLRGIGGFGGFFKLHKEKYQQPILVSSADGVGTKLKLAILVNRHDGVGIDAVAMNVNDILCTAASPLFFLDYIAYSKLEPDVLYEIVKGVNKGCIQAGCSLIGGETAQMPGMYKEGDYDIAGFCVGIVERKDIIDGSKIEVSDVVIGLESNGLHSNGFSLVRKVFPKNELKRMRNELLKPTRIYVKPVLSLLQNKKFKSAIKGIAHITGGAFYDKIARILPDNINVRISKNSWVVPKIFRLIQNKGSIEDREMYHTFNMGMGMVLIVEAASGRAIIQKLAELRLKSWIIGEVVKGKKEAVVV